MTTEKRLYGVSTGDGNDGVSHMFADYYVRTDDPWLLARAASYACWKPKAWPCLDETLEVDGESEYTISAVLFEEPGFEPEHVDCDACGGIGVVDDGTGLVGDEDYEIGPAAFILEVFPAEEDETRDRPIYDSIEDALGDAEIARAKANR